MAKKKPPAAKTSGEEQPKKVEQLVPTEGAALDPATREDADWAAELPPPSKPTVPRHEAARLMAFSAPNLAQVLHDRAADVRAVGHDPTRLTELANAASTQLVRLNRLIESVNRAKEAYAVSSKAALEAETAFLKSLRELGDAAPLKQALSTLLERRSAASGTAKRTSTRKSNAAKKGTPTPK